MTTTSAYSCPEIALPQGFTSRPAHFEGDNDSVAVYTENGVVFVAAVLDGTPRVKIAPPFLGASTIRSEVPMSTATASTRHGSCAGR